jgi:hypothetical protein
MKKQVLAVIGIISALSLAGCGSGGGSNSSLTAVSGKVADGYLVGATVFLDKNGNYQLDAGEPSAITDANGAFALTVDPADVGRYPIVAIATKGVTIDKDTGVAVTSTYVLSMHSVSVAQSATGAVSGTASNFISPMSSQIRELMETGKYATMRQAMDALKTQLGLPAGTNMLADYVAANNTAMHTSAQNMAILMGSQMAQVIETSGSTTTVDVNRYRGMMGSIFSNMSSIRGANSTTTMSNLMSTMTTTLSSMPMTSTALPYRNMSTAFRGGMMGMM